MGLDSQLDDDFKELMDSDFFTTSATYNGASVSGVWSIGENPLERSGANVRIGKYEIHKSYLTAVPAYRDSIIIDGITWKMREIFAEDEYTYILILETSERPKL